MIQENNLKSIVSRILSIKICNSWEIIDYDNDTSLCLVSKTNDSLEYSFLDMVLVDVSLKTFIFLKKQQITKISNYVNYDKNKYLINLPTEKNKFSIENLLQNTYFAQNCRFYKGYEGEHIFIINYKKKIYFCTKYGLNNIESELWELYCDLGGTKYLTTYFEQDHMVPKIFSCVELYLVHPKLTLVDKNSSNEFICIEYSWSMSEKYVSFEENIQNTVFFKNIIRTDTSDQESKYVFPKEININEVNEILNPSNQRIDDYRLLTSGFVFLDVYINQKLLRYKILSKAYNWRLNILTNNEKITDRKDNYIYNLLIKQMFYYQNISKKFDESHYYFRIKFPIFNINYEQCIGEVDWSTLDDEFNEFDINDYKTYPKIDLQKFKKSIIPTDEHLKLLDNHIYRIYTISISLLHAMSPTKREKHLDIFFKFMKIYNNLSFDLVKFTKINLSTYKLHKKTFNIIKQLKNKKTNNKNLRKIASQIIYNLNKYDIYNLYLDTLQLEQKLE